MHRVENQTASSIFLTKFCKPSHAYATTFLAKNFLVPTIKLKKKVSIEFLSEACYFGTTEKPKKVFQNFGILLRKTSFNKKRINYF